jgi:hypothetical protein
MSRAVLIYPIMKCIERELDKARQDPHNTEIIFRYYKVRSSSAQPATVLAELISINTMSRLLGKQFDKAVLQDIEDLIFKMDQLGNAPRTINRRREILKNFYRWMHNLPRGQFPDIVRWISIRKVPKVAVTAEDLIPYDVCVKIGENAS